MKVHTIVWSGILVSFKVCSQTESRASVRWPGCVFFTDTQLWWDPHTFLVMERWWWGWPILKCVLQDQWQVPIDTLFSFWLGHSDYFYSSCVFKDSSQVFDIRAVNISATNMTLTWKIKYNDGLSFPYTYKIHVAGETNSINQTVNKTEAIIHGLSSSTLYNITVRPFLGHIEGTPGFLQVYTCKFTPWYLVWFAFLLWWW